MFRLIYKTLYLTTEILRSCYFKLKYNLIWELGRKIRIEGRIVVPSYGGRVKIGDGTRIGPDVRLDSCKQAEIIIGRNVSINQGTIIVAKERVTIGDDCRIGEYVSIRDNDHKYNDPKMPIRKQGFITKATTIGNDVWIGRGSVICKGVKVGNGAVVGASSVVTKDIEPYAIVVGIPAKKIKSRRDV